MIVTEGEKAADAAALVFPNSVVITSPGGSKAAKFADWRPLAGRPVMIWPDNDPPGLGYAVDVERELAAIGAGTVTTIDAMKVAAVLPTGEARNPPEGWDAADGIGEDGWEPEALAALILQHVDRAEPAPDYVSFGRFSMNSDGLAVEVTKGRGETATVENMWISAPFEVIGRARDPHGFAGRGGFAGAIQTAAAMNMLLPTLRCTATWARSPPTSLHAASWSPGPAAARFSTTSIKSGCRRASRP